MSLHHLSIVGNFSSSLSTTGVLPSNAECGLKIKISYKHCNKSY